MLRKFIPIVIILNISFIAYGQQLTLEAIFKYNLFIPTKVEGMRFMNDGKHYLLLVNRSQIVKFNIETGEQTDVLFSIDQDTTGSILEITDYQINNNETTLLLTTTKKDLYRHSFISDFYIYSIEEKSLKSVFNEGQQQLATLSPDGCKVAFVFNNNLYLKDIHTSSLKQVTNDGIKNKIINGAPDWVYEEEFTLVSGFLWSPDSRKIAYYRFDESLVQEYFLVDYDSSRPFINLYKYPRAGEENSIVEIYVYDLLKENSIKMIASPDSDFYIPRVKWLPNSDKLAIYCLNRLQNRADIYLSDASTGNSSLIYTEQNDRFVSQIDDDFIVFADSGSQALIMSEKSGFFHIYRYKIDGSFMNKITSGYWEVEDILGFDDDKDILYYTSTEKSPIERHIYSIKLDGTGKKQLTSAHGVHYAEFSNNYDNYLLTSSNANKPPEYVVYNAENEEIRVLEKNDLITRVSEYLALEKKDFFSFQNRNGDTLYGYEVLPDKFKKNKKYPLLVYVYGGPEWQSVLDQWEKQLAWMQLMSQQGYVVVCIDNRGTNGRGAEFEKCTYLHLGEKETEDQIDLANYMSKKSYINKNRIGIFGSSYGGYMTLLCLLEASHIFKVGVALAPVTNWRFYDSIYTERFLRKPDENPKGYDEYSPLLLAENLEGSLLLIHGVADDNVHVQHSMAMAARLVELDKNFEMQFYPGQDHGFSGENATFHVFKRITDYITNNL